MTPLGALLRSRRGRDSHSAWMRPNLQGPESLIVTSDRFGEGQEIPQEHAGKRVGGNNLSPDLMWTESLPGTTVLLLVVEDLDVPTSKPAVHCLALIDPSQLDSPDRLSLGALSAMEPAAGVQILRSTISRGYHGPEPIKGHGPHRYTFQLFAFSGDLGTSADSALHRLRPRALLASVTAPVLARGRLTGSYER